MRVRLVVVLAAAVAISTAAGAVRAADMTALEQALTNEPENLKLGAEYRQLAIAAGAFDRPIDFFEKLAKRRDAGPNVYVSLAFAYVDKVPTSGDIKRLYLGRDAMNALTKAIAKRPSVLAYYMRGLINLYYNSFIFKRTGRGVADLNTALSMIGVETPPRLVARVYIALGDGYFRVNDPGKARETWSAGAARFPNERAFQERLTRTGEPLADIVTGSLTASNRVDTSLVDMLAGPLTP
jgi:tetratricopeptide (TPR) repeat protein